MHSYTDKTVMRNVIYKVYCTTDACIISLYHITLHLEYIKVKNMSCRYNFSKESFNNINTQDNNLKQNLDNIFTTVVQRNQIITFLYYSITVEMGTENKLYIEAGGGFDFISD